MTEVPQAQLASLIEESDLFSEFMELPQARRYRSLLTRSDAWRLEAGEALADPAKRTGAYVVLSGSAGDPAVSSPPPAEGDAAATDGTETAAAASPRIFGQWTGLRGVPLEERVVAREASVILELEKGTLEELLADVASLFKVEFYRPFLQQVPSIADAAPDALDPVIRRSQFRLFPAGSPVVREGDYGSTMFFILAGAALVKVPGGGATFPLAQGDFFGEIAVLAYQPRSATVIADGVCLTMEADRDGVAELRKRSATFKELVQRRYRERAMLSQLASTSFFQGLETAELEAVRDIATLEQYVPYQPLFHQGEIADAFFIVLNGHVTVVQESEKGPVPVAWIGDGDTVGELAMLPEVSGSDRRQQTVTALQRVDAIRIDRSEFAQLMARLPSVKAKLSTTAGMRMEMNRGLQAQSGQRRADRLAWMLDTQHVAGNWVLAVDMADCIRCNNCVTACESVHADGLSRFHWSNMRQDEDVMPHVRFTNSCQHCEVALCQVPCPTQCIERDAKTGAVWIDYDRCIKCGKCSDPSQGCPYGSIYVVPTPDVRLRKLPPILQWLEGLLPESVTHAEVGGTRKGANYPVKCDLCHSLPYQACVQHCPTGAVFRVDGDRQFAQVLTQVDGNGQARGNRPGGEPLPLYLTAEFEKPPVAGRPSELAVRIRREGPGLPLFPRRPEQGVTAMKVNLYLSAPDSFRVGGGALRQFMLPLDRPEANAGYAVTQKVPGAYDLSLAAYQGGLYLGHLDVKAEFTK